MEAARGLPSKANLRDDLDTDDLSYVMAAEVRAADRIRDEERHGNYDCADASKRSAGFIREAVERDKKDRQKRLIK